MNPQTSKTNQAPRIYGAPVRTMPAYNQRGAEFARIMRSAR